jgi:putative endonuclease
MYFIYIIRSEASGNYYVGHTDDYKRRLRNTTQATFDTFTKKFRPWNLVAVFNCGESKAEAMKLEKFIKKQKSKRLLETLIDPAFIPTGPLAQLVRVPDLRD